MPYLTTTHRRLDDPTAESLPSALPGVERRAVATLKDAQREVTRIIDGIDAREPWQFSDQARALTKAGGTITLPDGTEIEVEPVDHLECVCGIKVGTPDLPTCPVCGRDVFDAYNAAQS